MHIFARTFAPRGQCDWSYHKHGENAMSHYVFLCLDCNQEFTQHLLISEFEKGEMTCPICGSKRVSQRVEAFAAVTSKKS